MRAILFVLPFIVLSFLTWGTYGPLLHEGQFAMGAPNPPCSLTPFICVGIAYFLIAVVVPVIVLLTKGEKGKWTLSGAIWSFLAGAAGAIGALGIILAFKFGGKPVFVMPLVFGLAPVVNTMMTMGMNKAFHDANPVFLAGIIMVAIGASGVLLFKPSSPPKHAPAVEVQDAAPAADASAPPATDQLFGPIARFTLVLLSIAITAVSWGSYGPVLHVGQKTMQGSRLRPFLCVGLAYFVIAVLVPLPLLQVFHEQTGDQFVTGAIWSLAAGAAGAIGALGIILAFNFGGRPIYVMPLVFGGAPVINTFTTIVVAGLGDNISPFFYASLILVIAGAVTVLVFAPSSKKPAKSDKQTTSSKKKAEEDKPWWEQEKSATAASDESAEGDMETELHEDTHDNEASDDKAE